MFYVGKKLSNLNNENATCLVVVTGNIILLIEKYLKCFVTLISAFSYDDIVVKVINNYLKYNLL